MKTRITDMFGTSEFTGTSAIWQMQSCRHCGAYHPGRCPRIKAIEYHKDGSVKRVEYKE